MAVLRHVIAYVWPRLASAFGSSQSKCSDHSIAGLAPPHSTGSSARSFGRGPSLPSRRRNSAQTCLGSKFDPDFHMCSMTTASFRATATRAFRRPTFLDNSNPQLRNELSAFVEHRSTIPAATKWDRVSLLPKRVILPTRDVPPD